MIEHIPIEIMSRLETVHGELGAIIQALHAVAEPQTKQCEVPRKMEMENIVDAVCEIVDVAADEMLKPCCRGRNRLARNLALYLCRKLTTRSLPEISRLFNCRSFGACIAGLKAHEKLMSVDDEWKETTLRALSRSGLSMADVESVS